MNSYEEFGKVTDEQVTEVFVMHLAKVHVWLDEQTNFSPSYFECTARLAEPTKQELQVK